MNVVTRETQTNARVRTDPSDVLRDAIIPSLESIGRLLNVSEAEADILASYDGQVGEETLWCKSSRRSGRYNNYDTISTSPELRWPNESFHGSSGKNMVTI